MDQKVQLKMYFLAIFFSVASAAVYVPQSKYMPNIEYFLRGYNVLKGNPHQTSVAAVDPGFQEPIFRLSYSQGTITPDDKYCSPDGTLVTICQSCSLQAVTKKISGMNSYRDSLSEKVEYSGAGECLECRRCPLCPCPWCPWWCHYAFSQSVDYKKVQTEIHQYSNFYTHSDASCCAYQVQTDLYKPPPFSSDFLRGIITLPEDCTTKENKALYRKFIDSFGTNYIKQADMGSLFGQEIKVSEESWKSMLNQSIDIDRSLSLSFIFAYIDKDTMKDEEKTKIEKFHKFISSRSLYTKGSKPPKDGNLSKWIGEAKNSPAPIGLELGSMVDLFTSLHVPQPIIKCMNESLYEYCDNNICKDLKPDRLFHWTWKEWLTNFTGPRSQAQFCSSGAYVTYIQFARGSYWHWGIEGLYDLRFKCSTGPDTWKNFTAIAPPLNVDWGIAMNCEYTSFKKMSTYLTRHYNGYPVNVRAQCDVPSPSTQYAFLPHPPETVFADWVSCNPGEHIVGFQVQRQTFTDRIMNFRFACA